MRISIFTSIIAYISTNIDDIFVIMILLSQAATGTKGRLIAGHFLGVGVITVISMLGALGLQNLPLKYTGILGLVPIWLGIRAWISRKKDSDDEDVPETQGISLLSMALITIGNGADNVGVYIPLFTGFSGGERLGALVIFSAMTALWVFLANTLAEFPKIKVLIGKYKPVLIPLVFILLGIYIIMDSGLLG